MTLNFEQFKEKLLMYGADVRCWPKDIRSSGLKALDSSPELQKLVEDEERFEGVLKIRKYEEPSRDLAGRIVAAALPRKQKAQRNLGVFFSEALREFSLSRRSLTAVSVSLIFTLIMGFTIGFSNPSGYASAEQYETKLEDFLNYEGDVL
ncbi:MAG TPA: hypothetical protein VMW06_05330 [Desulfobacterales bacterium]|nr:hypothetical protein [Desulfobacterales bacterium]